MTAAPSQIEAHIEAMKKLQVDMETTGIPIHSDPQHYLLAALNSLERMRREAVKKAEAEA